MSNQKQVLSTYIDIIDLIKSGLVTDINATISNGTLDIDERTSQQLLALIDTLVSTYSANGYEQLQRITKTKKRKGT